MECNHVTWQVNGSNNLGFGQCHDCGKQISLAVLFDNQRKRTDEFIAQLEQKIKE